jgi:iron complex outermembrane receptor protein
LNVAKRLNLLAGAAAAAFILPAGSHALAAAPTVQEVVVTANKRTEKLHDVAQEVTAVSGAQLDLQQAAHFEDYVNVVPGFNFVSEQVGQSRLVLDGVNTGGDSATVATYVDETPYGSATGLANGGVLAPDLDTFDVNRIEVLRGPQGTLYGASSLGGVLKFVTNAPDPTRFSAKVEADGESTDKGGNGGSVKAMVNVPISDEAAIRVSGFYTDEGGFINDPQRDAKDINEAKFNGGRFAFYLHPTAKLTVRLTAAAQNILSNGSSAVDLDPTTLQPPTPTAPSTLTHLGYYTQSRAFAETDQTTYRIFNATEDYDFGGADLLSSTSYGTLHQSYEEDASTEIGAPPPEPAGFAIDQGLEQKKFTQEVRLTSKPQTFEWLIGGFFTREQNVLDQDIQEVASPSKQVLADGLEVVRLASVYSEYAVFGNVDYHFTDQFDLSVGGRYSYNKQDSGETISGSPFPPANSSEGVFTFAVAPKYKINDDVTVYARVSRGYRPGGPNDLPPGAPPSVPHTFLSDSLIDYQAGVKADFLDKTVSLDASVFYIDWSRIQLLADVQNFGVNINGGRARSDGVEASLTYTPFAGLNLSANGAYTDATLRSDTPALLGGFKGNALPYSAKWTGALNADYGFAIADATRAFVGGSLRYVGDRKSDFDATIGQIELPSYTSVDLHGGIDWKNYRIEVYAKNVNNARGILSLTGYGATPYGAVQAGIERPRTIGVSLSAKY